MCVHSFLWARAVYLGGGGGRVSTEKWGGKWSYLGEMVEFPVMIPLSSFEIFFVHFDQQ